MGELSQQPGTVAWLRDRDFKEPEMNGELVRGAPRSVAVEQPALVHPELRRQLGGDELLDKVESDDRPGTFSAHLLLQREVDVDAVRFRRHGFNRFVVTRPKR